MEGEQTGEDGGIDAVSGRDRGEEPNSTEELIPAPFWGAGRAYRRAGRSGPRQPWYPGGGRRGVHRPWRGRWPPRYGASRQQWLAPSPQHAIIASSERSNGTGKVTRDDPGDGLSSSVLVPPPNEDAPRCLSSEEMLGPSSLSSSSRPLHPLTAGTSSHAVQSLAPLDGSSKLISFPPRPGRGTAGTKCIVKANYFLSQFPEKDIHHYDVTIMPELASARISRAVMETLVKLYRETHLGRRLPAYDGRRSLYTAGPLPFHSKEFEIILTDDADAEEEVRRGKRFHVVLRFAARASLRHVAMFLEGRRDDTPQESLQALDIVLRENATARYTPVGRAFFSPEFGPRQSISGGAETWLGFHQSLKPTMMGLSLNIDISTAVFIEPLSLIDFVSRVLSKDIAATPLNNRDHTKIKKFLMGLKIEITHRANVRRKYHISGLTSQATRDIMFHVDGGSIMISVVEFLQKTHGYIVQYPNLPCVQVGSTQRPNYLPMEVCKMVKGQKYSKQLNRRQIMALLNVTCRRPHERERDITQIVRHNAYKDDSYAAEFGIKINEKLCEVEARLLPAPQLKYHDSGKEKDCLPEVGKWNMINKKMVDGGTVDNWMCINFSGCVEDVVAQSFCHELAVTCLRLGMKFKIHPVLKPYHADPDKVEKALTTLYHDAKKELEGQALDLLLVILPNDNGSLYGDVKRICDTQLGIVTQCCLAKSVFMLSRLYLENVVLKVNVKVGGSNTVLVDALSRSIPMVSDIPTIIFGADVSHPRPGEDSSASIAAVVASHNWPEISKYAGLVSSQAHRQEIIADLYKTWEDPIRGQCSGGMIREHLISFKEATGQKPQRIIYYRDGVGDGQFYQVLLSELGAIRKACASLDPSYHPPVTFVVVQKRHSTRLFTKNHNVPGATDKSGNILPVVRNCLGY